MNNGHGFKALLEDIMKSHGNSLNEGLSPMAYNSLNEAANAAISKAELVTYLDKRFESQVKVAAKRLKEPEVGKWSDTKVDFILDLNKYSGRYSFLDGFFKEVKITVDIAIYNFESKFKYDVEIYIRLLDHSGKFYDLKSRY